MTTVVCSTGEFIITYILKKEAKQIGLDIKREKTIN